MWCMEVVKESTEKTTKLMQIVALVLFIYYLPSSCIRNNQIWRETGQYSFEFWVRTWINPWPEFDPNTTRTRPELNLWMANDNWAWTIRFMSVTLHAKRRLPLRLDPPVNEFRFAEDKFMNLLLSIESSWEGKRKDMLVMH